jgi:glycosyltransferase involved in cell wall biosynthesis
MGIAAAAPSLWQYRQSLRNLLWSTDPDIIHTNGIKMHLLGIWSRSSNARIIWHVHDYVSARPFTKHLFRRWSGQADALVAVSESVARDLRVVSRHPERIHTVPNAVDTERFAPAGPRSDLDKFAGMPPPVAGTIRVGLVATLARWKGHDVFLRALAAIAPHAEVRGYVIGGALYQTAGSQWSLTEIRERIVDLELADRVGCTGFLDDVPSAMRALDIVVHASTAPEPFGLVIAEAMSCGRAVIASATGGAADLITHGVDGLTHRPGNSAELADCIARLVRDPQLRLRCGEAARESALKRFHCDRLSHQMIPIYREAVARHAG